MSKKPTLSVCLAVYNEASNISKCLASVKGLADEIVVVDGQSTDSTVNLARKFKARIISTSNKPNFHINKNIAIDAARSDWILQLDADEAISQPLFSEILNTINSSNACDGYWMPRLNDFLGVFLKKGGQYPDYTLRLYRKGKGRLPAIHVHEQAEVKGTIGYLKNDLLHYGTPDFENYLTRYNRYTSLIAEKMKSEGTNLTTLTLLKHIFLLPLKEFATIYLRHKGFMDGFPGFVFAWFSGLRFAVAYIKYWQLTKFPA